MNLPEDTYSHGPLQSEQDAISDIDYFMNKLKACEDSRNVEGASRCKRQLALLEDAVVIYRLTREPDRDIRVIDVGNIPKAEAEKKKLNPPPSNE